MTYEEARALRDRLEDSVKQASDALKAIPGVGAGHMGMTPDSVKATREYRQARQTYETTLETLRRFNSVFTKVFRAEIRAERSMRRLADQLVAKQVPA